MTSPPKKLSHIHVLIMDADYRISELVKRVLFSLGFKKISYAKNGKEGLEILKSTKIDLIITDWDMAPISGIEFIESIRQSDTSQHRTTPIIMLTGKAQQHHVIAARDAGITEFVVKPFSATTICKRITLIVDHPRNFVVSPDFTGPDRRRRTVKDIPVDRRGQKKVKITSKGAMPASDGVTIINANYNLKEKIGKDVDLKDLFSPAAIKQAQEVIYSSTDEFLTYIREDLQLLEKHFANLDKAHIKDKDDIRAMSTLALSIKSRGGTFDYHLASYVADSFYNIIIEHAELNAPCLQAIRSHMDMIYVILNEEIKDTESAIGEKITTMLQKLVETL